MPCWPWASSLIPVCRVRNVPRRDTLDTIYTRFVRGHALVERGREREREKEEIKGKGEKSDSNSLLHREHGHDVKAKRRRALHPSATFPSVAECQCLGRFLEFRRKIDDPQPGQPDNETLEPRSFTFLVVGQKSCSCRKDSRRISRAFIFACVFRFEFVVWVCAKLRFMAGSGV